MTTAKTDADLTIHKHIADDLIQIRRPNGVATTTDGREWLRCFDENSALSAAAEGLAGACREAKAWFNGGKDMPALPQVLDRIDVALAKLEGG